jgi:hypothetical protein
MTFLLIFGILATVSVFVLFIGRIVNAKLDWTKEKELLLWYDEYINEKKVRNYITLFKL